MRFAPRLPRVRFDGDDPVVVDAEVEAVEAGSMCLLGHDDPAIRVPDVVRELRAPPGRVDADDRGSGERGSAEQEAVLGNVVEQHPDVERRALGAAGRTQHRGSHRALVRDLRPRPRSVFEDQSGARVVGARRDELGDRPHAHLPAERVGCYGVVASGNMTEALVHPDWVRRLNLFGDVVGDPRLLAGLEPDELLATARASTGLEDLGEDDWPGWTETYRRMVTAIDEESRLHALGRVVTRAELVKVLQTWLRLQRVWSTRSAIRAESIEAPLFVVGPPRTGTTILLELLALDPQLRAPVAWEALHPLADEGDAERRRELSECEQEFWADIHPEFMTMHELASDLPCECVHFLMYDFAGPYWSMLYDTPSFTGWQLENLDTLGRVYRLHRRMLQTFQHDSDDGTGAAPRRGCSSRPGICRRWPRCSPSIPTRASSTRIAIRAGSSPRSSACSPSCDSCAAIATSG